MMFAILKIFIIMARIGNWQHLGYLYILWKDYSILDWTKAKKLKSFSDQRKIENAKQFDCQAFDIGSTLENLSV